MAGRASRCVAVVNAYVSDVGDGRELCVITALSLVRNRSGAVPIGATPGTPRLQANKARRLKLSAQQPAWRVMAGLLAPKVDLSAERSTY